MERRCRRNSLALPTLAAKCVFPEFFLKEEALLKFRAIAKGITVVQAVRGE
jgi:hypothetical protein